MPTSKSFVAEITIPEQIALEKAFNRYFLNGNGRSGDSGARPTKQDNAKIRRSAEALVSKFKDMFMENPAVAQKVSESAKSKEDFFKLNDKDIRSLYMERSSEEYQNKPELKTPKLKGRLMIFALEVKGFYHAPKSGGQISLHQSVVENIFNNDPQPIKTDICGIYRIFRLSFNNSLPNHVAVYLIEIFRDDNDESVIRYRSANNYSQEQGGSEREAQKRNRVSQGHVYNYQEQLFFLGGVSYNHVDYYDAPVLADDDSKSSYNHYPEIMMFHPHGGDMLNVRGIMLAHYPYLGLPIATRAYLTRFHSHQDEGQQGEEGVFDSLMDSYITIDSESGKKKVPEHYGNFAIDSEQIYHPLQREVRKNISFIENALETTYSKMLTP